MRTCPQCHAPLPDDAPEGLCPACLLQRGLEANTLAGGTQPPGPEADRALQSEHREKWTPPTLEELEPFFPGLDLLEFLGRGGMGAVYKARQKSLDRIVALKILPPAIGQDAAGGGFAARFTYEAQAMARLNHPHIVTIFEFGQRQAAGLQGDEARASSPPLNASVPQSLCASHLYFFLMEFVDGLTLRQLINARTLRPQDALAIVPQICDALQYAHDRGIIHRDIKPENILLTRDGQIKIADFGLAKLMGSAPPTATPPAEPPVYTGIAGTPAYMAPEQSQTPSAVDHRADIYALGVVFYQLLTGELPKDGGTLVPPSKKVQIDVRLDEIVLRALEKSPNLRYQNATQLKTEVETLISTPPAFPAPMPAPVTPAPAAAATNSPVAPRPRLSKLAVGGALWSGMFFLAVLFVLVFRFSRADMMPPTIGAEGMPGSPIQTTSVLSGMAKLLALALNAVGFPAIVGTTICGIISVVRIRRSNGTLTGLPLALYDLLVFPLLALDTIIWLILYGIMSYVVTFQNVQAEFGRGPRFSPHVELVWLGTLILSALLDTLIAWIAWTLARPRSGSPSTLRPARSMPLEDPPNAGAQIQPPAKPKFATKPPLFTAVFHVCLLVLFTALLTYFVPRFSQVFHDLGGRLPDLTNMTIGFTRMIQHYFCLLVLPLLLVFFGTPFLVQYVGGRRLLNIYSWIVDGTLVGAMLVASATVALPALSLIKLIR